jgi:hypothetical protein
MVPRLRWLVLACSVPLLAAASAARADMYTWTDAAGRVNISNVAPPEGARITNVRHDVAPRLPPPDPAWEAIRAAEREREMQALAERARELEMQVLAERVRSLEREVESSQRRVAASMPMPIPYDYPAPPQYVASAASVNPGCDPSWAGCLWNPGWYSGFGGGVVVVGVPVARRYASFHGGQRFSPSRPGGGNGGGNGGGKPGGPSRRR